MQANKSNMHLNPAEHCFACIAVPCLCEDVMFAAWFMYPCLSRRTTRDSNCRMEATEKHTPAAAVLLRHSARRATSHSYITYCTVGFDTMISAGRHPFHRACRKQCKILY